MSSLRAYAEIMRIPNSLMMGLAVIVGMVITDPKSLIMPGAFTKVILGFLVGFLLTSSSMVFNDYADREIDAINEPSRPIPSGRVAPAVALFYGFILGFLGLLLSEMTGSSTLFLAALTFAVALLYNFKLKRYGFLGNLCVAYTVAVPLLYGSLLSSGMNLKVLLYASMIFLSIVGREITKGISDVEGDSRKGVRTVAVKYGSRTASLLAFLFFLAAISLSPLPFLLGLTNFPYLILVSITDAMLFYLSLLLVKFPDRKTAKMVKNRALIAMAVGLLAFALGSI